MTTTCSNLGNWTQTLCPLVVMFSKVFILSVILVTWLANQRVVKMQSQHTSQWHGMLFDCCCLFSPTVASAWKTVAMSLMSAWERSSYMAVRPGQRHMKISTALPLLGGMVRCGMVRLVCAVGIKQHVPTKDLHVRLGVNSIQDETRWCRLRYFGHLNRMDESLATCQEVDHTYPGVMS